MARFYLVDDDQEAIDMVTVLLEKAGHEVSSNISATFAISEILSLKPDCILTDFMMSEMDGLELCRELRKHAKLKDTKIYMLSSRTDELWLSRATEEGANGYLTKPIDPGSFVSELEKLLD